MAGHITPRSLHLDDVTQFYRQLHRSLASDGHIFDRFNEVVRGESPEFGPFAFPSIPSQLDLIDTACTNNLERLFFLFNLTPHQNLIFPTIFCQSSHQAVCNCLFLGCTLIISSVECVLWHIVWMDFFVCIEKYSPIDCTKTSTGQWIQQSACSGVW